MTGGCLGDVVAALVDGELDHAARERAHRHLAHCAGCRAEVDGQRRLKARLSGVDEPDLPTALTDRLLRLAAPVEEPALRRLDARPPSRPPAATTTPSRPAGGSPGSARPTAGRRRGGVRGRATAGSAFALLGVAAALALGAPPPRVTTTPVDPTTDAFVTEFVSATADGSSSVSRPARTASLTTFVPLARTPLVRTAASAGGARTTR